FHGLVGGWSLVALIVAWVLEGSQRPRWTTLWPGVLAALLLAAIGTWPAVAMNADVSADVVAHANQIYVYERLMHHLLPQTFKEYMVLKHLVLAAVLVGLWSSRPRGEGRFRLLSFAFGGVLIASAGWLIALTTADHPELGASLLRYYWFRLSDV